MEVVVKVVVEVEVIAAVAVEHAARTSKQFKSTVLIQHQH